jgi:ribosomal-protein-alanine N-acetyltransferase
MIVQLLRLCAQGTPDPGWPDGLRQAEEMTVDAPGRLQTARLVLERPRERDVEEIFHRYAGDAEVTRMMGWPRHRSAADTRGFLAFSDAEWERWKVGPYLARSRADGTLLGATGLHPETAFRASTGYVFARDAWGNGYATEALRAMVELAPSLGIARVQAFSHVTHAASRRVLEKCGFVQEGVLRRYLVFPNLGSEPLDVCCHAVLP